MKQRTRYAQYNAQSLPRPHSYLRKGFPATRHTSSPCRARPTSCMSEEYTPLDNWSTDDNITPPPSPLMLPTTLYKEPPMRVRARLQPTCFAAKTRRRSAPTSSVDKNATHMVRATPRRCAKHTPLQSKLDAATSPPPCIAERYEGTTDRPNAVFQSALRARAGGHCGRGELSSRVHRRTVRQTRVLLALAARRWWRSFLRQCHGRTREAR